MNTQIGDDRSMMTLVRDGVVKYGFIAVTILLFVYFAISEPSFRNVSTFFSMLKFASVVAILGLGVTFTMGVCGIDLSVWSVAGMSVALAAMTMVFCAKTGRVAIVVVMIAVADAGLVTGMFSVWLKLLDLLATLAIMFVITG